MTGSTIDFEIELDRRETVEAEQPPVVAPAKRSGRVARIARFAVRRPGLVLSVLVVLVIGVAAFAPGVLASGDPLDGDTSQRLTGPGLDHLFGTDELGRDVFTRVVHGAALSLKAVLLAVAVGFVVGGLVGLVSGFIGGWLDEAFMRLVDTLQSIPDLLLALALVTALGYGTVEVAIAVGVSSVAGFARITRAEVLRVRTATFVEAARSTGARWHQVLTWHVLPHAAGPALVWATLQVGTAVLAVSSLSFLGYGAQPPEPEWGSLISSGRNYLASAWWLATLPGLVIVAMVLSTNRISRLLDTEWKELR